MESVDRTCQKASICLRVKSNYNQRFTPFLHLQCASSYHRRKWNCKLMNCKPYNLRNWMHFVQKNAEQMILVISSLMLKDPNTIRLAFLLSTHHSSIAGNHDAKFA